MSLDHTSLLLAIIVLSGCLCVVLFAGWLAARTETFLFTWSVGLAVLAGAMTLFTVYLTDPAPLFALPVFALLLFGFAIVEGAGLQFSTGEQPARRIAIVSALSVLVIAPFFATGVDGAGTSLVNALAGAILISAGLHYWRGRAEAPILMPVLTALYAIVGLSFLVCAVEILAVSPIHRVRTPDNWAENLNALAAIVGLAGIGAISLALNQSRMMRRFRADSRTDELTGLANRRALFEAHGDMPLAPGAAVAVLDLDRFKQVNDLYGHAAGDLVLARFGELLGAACGPDMSVARTGGEEFVLVFETAPADAVRAAVERIRADFSRLSVPTKYGPLRCTVSAGLACVADTDRPLDAVLEEADAALYLAKRGGRNRVAAHRALVAA